MADYQEQYLGRQFGNYRLVKLLGSGGFAEVYLGEHLRLGTQAAVKILHTRLASHDDVEGFEKEARTVAHLKHPHIVRVLDYDVEEDTPFLVMDYAVGGTLRYRHPKGTRLPLTTITSYVKQVADALQYAHDQRVIHRDIKPENMLVGEHNDLLLSDFGIAIVAQSSRYQSTQQMGGTMAYIAPEQIQGHPRPASDQYSLGIVVYEWLSGDCPFHGSMTEIVAQHLAASPPPLQDKISTIASDVEQVVLTALGKDPGKRFSSVTAFAKALEKASESSLPTQMNQPLRTQINQAAPTVVNQPAPTLNNQSNTVIVSKTGEGNYTSISEAISNVSANTRILVRPGIYRESIVLNKRLEIVGDGAVGHVIIESSECCITMQTDVATVRNFTLRHQIGRVDSEYCTVDIPQGQLTLAQCDITSGPQPCISIYNPGAVPIIQHCVIHNEKGEGISCDGGGQGIIEDCEISGNWLGVEIKGGAEPTLRRCTFHHNQGGSIYLNKNGQGIIEDCEIDGPTGWILEGCNPIIRRCKVHDGMLEVLENGQGVIEDCEISGGITINKGSNPTFRRCKIDYNERYQGIFIRDGQAVIEDCEMLCLVRIEGGNPTIRRCKIHKRSGIVVGGSEFYHFKGQGIIENCEIFSNWEAGISIFYTDNTPTFRHCSIYKNEKAGIYIQHGQGHFEDCKIFSNNVGVEIEEEGNPSFCRCAIHDNKESGFLVSREGKGIIEDCEIFDNKRAGIEIWRGNLSIARCRINHNSEYAITADEEASGTVEYCDLTGNLRGVWGTHRERSFLGKILAGQRSPRNIISRGNKTN